jgi:hypothetical protein
MLLTQLLLPLRLLLLVLILVLVCGRGLLPQGCTCG